LLNYIQGNYYLIKSNTTSWSRRILRDNTRTLQRGWVRGSCRRYCLSLL